MEAYEMTNSQTELFSPCSRVVPRGCTQRLMQNIHEHVFKSDRSRLIVTIALIFLLFVFGFLILYTFVFSNQELTKRSASESPITTTFTPSTERTTTLIYTTTSTFTTTTTTREPFTPSSSKLHCTAGYKEFEKTGLCYKFIDHKTNFDGAQKVCESEGANLASIHSEEENDFLADLATMSVHTNRVVSELNQEIWIGLVKVSGVWKWVDGTPVDYTKWVNIRPNWNAEPQVTMVTSRIEGYSPSVKHWNNVEEFSIRRGLICKKAPV